MGSINGIYAELIQRVMKSPVTVTSRGEVTKREVCLSATFDSCPLVTVRKTAWRNALREWEWFMSGSNSILDLNPKVHHWWKPWVNKRGYIPYNYGHQFRHASFHNDSLLQTGEFDQIAWLIDAVKNHPFSRRNVITTWNTGEMAQADCPITNCHGTVIQVFGRYTTPYTDGTTAAQVESGVTIDLFMYQRSCDLILGVPHNWVQYWAFLLWLAHRTGTQPGRLIWQGGDVHVYEKHYGVANEITKACSDRYCDMIHDSPQMGYTPTSENFKAVDFATDDYSPFVTTEVEMVVGESK